MNYKTEIFGDYVLTPCKNAFNDKTSFWLTKKGMTCAMYCFSDVSGGYPYDRQVREIRPYIRMFQERFEQKRNFHEVNVVDVDENIH